MCISFREVHSQGEYSPILNWDDQPLSTTLLSQFHKLFSIHHPLLPPTNILGDKVKAWTTLDVTSCAEKYG